LTAQAYIAALEQKHQQLENELQSALTHSSADDRTITDLKRRKLQIKDELTRLRSGQ